MTAETDDALWALRLLSADPCGLGGAALRGRDGAAQWIKEFARVSGRSLVRAPAHADLEALTGGVDVSASLAAGRAVVRPGLLARARGGVLLVPGAERLDAAAAGLIAAAHDEGDFTLILIDESHEPEESPPALLLERVAFRLDLSAFWPFADAANVSPGPKPALPDAGCEALCAAADALGVFSSRADILAARAARAAAACESAPCVEEGHLALAARLVLAPRATRAPAPEPSPAPGEEDASEAESGAQDPAALKDVLVQAAQAALPEALLAGLALGGALRRGGPRGTKGATRQGVGRGRTIGARSGAPAHGRKLHLSETLRAAAPWQRLRGRAPGERLRLRREDLRIARIERPSRNAVVFVVDASGSSAAQRLGEAKGAVELLLAQAYVRRTEAALVAFRGVEARVLLPATRSLARAKRELADLVGGGATPLAAGLDAALALAEGLRARGRAPLVIVLSDGRANMTRAGAVDRVVAEAEAISAAGMLRASKISAAFVDTAPRPRAEARRLAEAMGARYAPLPYMNAAAIKSIAAEPNA